MHKPIILHKTTSTTAMPVGATILQTSPSMFMTTGDGAVLASVGAGALPWASDGDTEEDGVEVTAWLDF